MPPLTADRVRLNWGGTGGTAGGAVAAAAVAELDRRRDMDGRRGCWRGRSSELAADEATRSREVSLPSPTAAEVAHPSDGSELVKVETMSSSPMAATAAAASARKAGSARRTKSRWLASAILALLVGTAEDRGQSKDVSTRHGQGKVKEHDTGQGGGRYDSRW